MIKPIWVSHRGNINGSNPSMENNPEYIKQTLNAGFDVEVDAWIESDGLYLGHDAPIYKIDKYFLQNQKIWTHCKNVITYLELSKFSNINCFFQNDEEIVATTRGYFWAHSKCMIWNNKTIVTKLDSRNWGAPENVFGICSDYIESKFPNYILPFDLLILDIDGVMTDGTKMYDREGKVFGKTYCDLDFTAIKRFIAAGINVCFLSGDQTVNKAMAESRKITFFHNEPGVDKADMLNLIKSHFKSNCTAYIGDDYYDLGIMNLVEFPFCPKTSPNAITNIAKIINVDAGKGVVAKLYDMFDNSIPFSFPIDSIHVNPK